MKYSLIILLLLTIFCEAYSQNRVETKSGAEYSGMIIKNTEDSLVIRMNDSALVTLPKSAIQAVYYNVPPPEDGNFWSLGATLGTPAVLQLAGSYDFERYGLRLSAGYIGRGYGGQINVFRKFSRSADFSHELSVVGGYSYLDGENEFIVIGSTLYYDPNISEWLYGGLAYSVHWHGIFGELGLAVGDGSFSNPQLMLQLGYLYEFR